MSYIITNHARERFVERFSETNRKAYAHLRECNGCQRCVSLTFRLKREVDTDRAALDQRILAMLAGSYETRIHHNNFRFMQNMADKYGDHPARFLVNGDTLFIVLDAPEGKLCVTCLNAKTSVLKDFVRRPKFKKKVVTNEC